MTNNPPSLFLRWVLPGLAFKAVVIGGGYATGRELAEFFLPSGPWGGVLGMLLAMAIWSMVCVLTFVFAFQSGARDYAQFIKALMGPAYVVFEVAYLVLLLLILSVFSAAAGAIGHTLFGWPDLVGALALMAGIATATALGDKSVERVFKYVSFLLYGVYGLFLILCLLRFHGRIGSAFEGAALPSASVWVAGGVTYASYNAVMATAILPTLRHMRSTRDALVAGLFAGPLAMLPAIVFFICMAAFYPAVGAEALPSDFLLRQLGQPAFHLLFQLMIFSALLESGTGAVHAVNARLRTWRASRGGTQGKGERLAVALGILVAAVFAADRIGLIALIGSGYRFLAWLFLAVFLLPLLTVGLWRVVRRSRSTAIA
jgi:uncharacterized membrane protein YkvI